MKKTVATLVLLTALLAACGADTAKNIDGPWLGQLFYPDATPAGSFSATLKQESGSAVDVSGFVLDGPSCFSPPLTSSAMFSATGSSGGFVIGTFTMTVSTAFPGPNNVLTVSGTRTSGASGGPGITSPTPGSISGTWEMTGQTGCTGHGILIMKPSAST